MKVNQLTAIEGSKVILVPYEKIHVAKYHSWMENSELRQLTGSEQLSLEEEYEMQQKWADDNDKCTFIILSKELYQTTKCQITSMIGDVNLFIDSVELETAEIEIMIAEPNWQNRGIGLEATVLMLLYGINTLKLRKFRAKIGRKNEKSIRLFHFKLGFIAVSESKVFDETTLELVATDSVLNDLRKLVPEFDCVPKYQI